MKSKKYLVIMGLLFIVSLNADSINRPLPDLPTQKKAIEELNTIISNTDMYINNISPTSAAAKQKLTMYQNIKKYAEQERKLRIFLDKLRDSLPDADTIEKKQLIEKEVNKVNSSIHNVSLKRITLEAKALKRDL